MKAGNVSSALKKLSLGFDPSDQIACLKLGNYLSNTLNRKKLSIPLYMAAAKGGNKKALLRAKKIISGKFGSRPLHPVLFKLFKKYSQKKNDAKLYFHTGHLIYKSKQQRTKINETIKFWKLAAKMKWPNAYRHLALVYAAGYLVDKNIEFAEENYRKFMQFPNSQHKIYILGKILEGHLENNNVKRVKEIATIMWQHQSPKGILLIANAMYKGDQNFPKNRKKAIDTYHEVLKSERRLLARSYYNLGQCYKRGKLCKKDKSKYIEYLRLAARDFDAQAAYKLGKAFEKGKLVPKDPLEAFILYLIAIYKGYSPAIGASNKIMKKWELSSKKVLDNVIKFKFFYIMNHGRMKLSRVYDANLNQGISLFFGLSAKADPQQGMEVVKKSIENGNRDAVLVLKMIQEELKSKK
ncbi:sel1 repeat family protein [bacterium]|nr:sel1 repeat family protein [bacterium]